MFKKTLIATTLAVLSSTALAAADGIYLGGQVGGDNTHYTSGDLGAPANVDNTGWAGRVFGGYQFTKNWAAELGYSRFSNTKFSNIAGTGLNGTVKEYAIDLVGKAMLPLNYGFGVYGVAGAAWMKANTTGSLGGSASRLFPTFGAGISYDITPNLPVDVSYRRFQKTGNSPIQSVDFYGAGISWHFG